MYLSSVFVAVILITLHAVVSHHKYMYIDISFTAEDVGLVWKCLLPPTSRSATHATRAHRHAPATADDQSCHRHPDRVVLLVPVHPGDMGGQRRLADKHMVSICTIRYY